MNRQISLKLSTLIVGIVGLLTITAFTMLPGVTEMDLGEFSISLNVEDIHASKGFYEKLGFEQIAGDINQNWVIMKNGKGVVGLFHGMFDHNIMTFNPTDVRSIQSALKGKGVSFVTEADESTTGPAHAILADPDGNVILLDQHY